MKYNSTTNKDIKVTAAEAIAQGLSSDGGLFVPQEIPLYDEADLNEMLKLDYNGRAKKILSAFLSDFSAEEINDCVEKAYTKEKFGGDNPCPMPNKTINDVGINILELWHGPTCAFKDMALQILPHLLTKSLGKVSNVQEADILVATSGDTGKAALEGFKDVAGTRIIVFYPENGVSPMQKHQMNTQEGENVDVCAINGNFDDAQTGVKKIFTTREIGERLKAKNKMFSSANSINWGRLLPQIVYYFSAYCDLVNQGKISLGDKVNITVPTGNFGNILASYYAMRMGMPVNKFICASNSNKVLTDFINSGTYDKNRDFYTTVSPSMDILVSSNLERLLYHLSGENDDAVKSWMQSLKNEGAYSVSEDVKTVMQDLFYGGFCTEDETKDTIKELYSQSGYLCDTHTAVAIKVYQQYVKDTGDNTECILASTASPYKFSKSVLEAIAGANETQKLDEFQMVEKLFELTKTKVPQPISELKDKSVRFSNLCDVKEMPQYVLDVLGV